MYLPPHFKAQDLDIAWALIREHPLGSVISQDDKGAPFVSHVPLHLNQDRESPVLFGHFARANPHWKCFKDRPQALVTFMGPQAYVSPQIYPDLARVPTWNYLAVHAQVDVRLLDDAQAKDALLKQLIADHEPPYAAQWRGLDESFQDAMLSGIVAFEMSITSLACKVKLNQHRPESLMPLYKMYQNGTPQEQSLADWMVRLRLVTPL
jgi:transcriptional regulator